MKKVAVITGASSGIGEAFAKAFSKIDYDLILVARRKDRLDNLARVLKESNEIEVEVYQADLAIEGEVSTLANYLNQKRIDVLVNNAGFGIGKPFLEIDEKDLHKMIQVHCTAAMDLMHTVLPGMIERDEGAIINVASLAGLMPVPGSSLYPASKSFLVSLTESVKASMSSSNVRLQALCPGYTISEFHSLAYPEVEKIKRKKLLWMSSEEVAEYSIKALEKNKVICIPGWVNKFIVFASKNFLVAPILQKIVRKKKNL